LLGFISPPQPDPSLYTGSFYLPSFDTYLPRSSLPIADDSSLNWTSHTTAQPIADFGDIHHTSGARDEAWTFPLPATADAVTDSHFLTPFDAVAETTLNNRKVSTALADDSQFEAEPVTPVPRFFCGQCDKLFDRKHKLTYVDVACFPIFC
jgi:hypothetical protein